MMNGNAANGYANGHNNLRLSKREAQIVVLVARGMTNKEIAREIGCSDATVKVHMHSIFIKFGVRNRATLVSIYLTK